MRTITSSCDRAFSALGAIGYDAARASQLLHAHDQGCCYLCHVPYTQTLDECVCPHWLIMPWPSLERVRRVLAVYELPAIVHFLLAYAKAGYRVRQPADVISASGDAQRQQLLIKAQRRHWSFVLHTDPAGGAQRLHFHMKSRSSKDFGTWLVPGERDVAFFHTLLP